MLQKAFHTYRVEYRFRRITPSGAKKRWSYDYKFQNSTDYYRAGQIVKKWMENNIYKKLKRKGSFLEVQIRKVEEV